MRHLQKAPPNEEQTVFDSTSFAGRVDVRQPHQLAICLVRGEVHPVLGAALRALDDAAIGESLFTPASTTALRAFAAFLSSRLIWLMSGEPFLVPMVAAVTSEAEPDIYQHRRLEECEEVPEVRRRLATIMFLALVVALIVATGASAVSD
jgi:hypothetical protein